MQQKGQNDGNELWEETESGDKKLNPRRKRANLNARKDFGIRRYHCVSQPPMLLL